VGLLNSRLGLDDEEIKEKKVNIPSYSVDIKEDAPSIKEPEPVKDVMDDRPPVDDPDDILAAIGVKRKPAPKKEEKPRKEPETFKIESPEELTEEALELYQLKEARSANIKEQRSRRNKRIIYTLLILACAYMIFLIYGVFCTDYAYDDNGKIVPVVLSVRQIREKNEFDKLKVQYENARVLYEKVLLLDYRLSQGVEDPIALAPEYEALLDDVNNLTIKIDALDVDTRYETVKQLLLNFVKTDTAVYLQKISSGISGNNGEDADVAVQYKYIMYDDFSIITQNIITIGDGIEGSDMTNIKKWDPDKFIEDTVGGH